MSRPKRQQRDPAAAHNEALRTPAGYAEPEQVPIRFVSSLLEVSGARTGFWRGWPYVQDASGQRRVYSADGESFELVSKAERRQGASRDEAAAFLNGRD